MNQRTSVLRPDRLFIISSAPGSITTKALLALAILTLTQLPATKAANTERDVIAGQTDLTAASTYVGNVAPSNVTDITFTLSGTYGSLNTFTVNSSIPAGAVADFNSTPLTILNNGAANDTLILGTGTSENSVAAKNLGLGAATDIIYVGSGSNLTFSNGTHNLGVVLGTFGNFDVATTGTLNLNSALTGAMELSKDGGGTVLLTAANSFGSTVSIYGGTLQFSGALGANSTATPYVLGQGSFILDNTVAAGGNNSNRIADTSTIAFGGASFIDKGSDAAGVNSTETLGALSGGGGTFSVIAGGTNSAIVTAASFTHAVSNGTEFVNGVSLGSTGSAANRVILTTAPTLVGTTAPTIGINAASQNTSIVPFLVGESATASGGLGTTTGSPDTFLTYIAGGGLRPLNPTDEFTNNAVTAGNNTYITAATNVAASTAINSLVINGGNLSINDGQTLTNTSGALLFAASGAITPAGTTGLYASSAENQITVAPGVTGTMAAAISGAGALTKSGAGILLLGASNSYTGNTYVQGGTLALGINNALPATTNLVIGDKNGNTGNLDFSNFSQSTGVASFAISTAGPALDTVVIGAGQTFNVAGNVTVGAGAVGPANTDTQSNAAFTGAGTFAITKAGGVFQLGAADTNHTNSANLDLSGLANFNANLGSTGTFRVGDNSVSGVSDGNGASTLKLAQNSTITANLLGIADMSGEGATNGADNLLLGSGTNILNTNIINIATYTAANSAMRGQGNLAFTGTSGSVVIRAANGTSGAVLTLDQNDTNLSNNSATINLAGHYADIRLANLLLADRNGTGGTVAANGATATFTFDTGILDVTTGAGSAIIGQHSGTNSTGNDSGTLNLGSATTTSTSSFATLIVGNATATASGTGNGGTATGVVNIKGGVVNANTVTLAVASANGVTSNGTINLTGGTFNLNGNIARGAAGSSSVSNATINLNGGTLNLNGHSIGLSTGTGAITTTFTAGTLENVGEINGGSGFNKTGAGTLNLAGVNAFTGTNTVTAGTLIVSGSLTGAAALNVNGGNLEADGVINAASTITTAALVSGTGTVGTVNVSANGNLAPGLTAGSTSGAILTAANNVTFSGSSSNFTIRLGVAPGGTDNDQLALTSGSATLNSANLQLSLGANYADAANLGLVVAILNGGANPVSGQFLQGNSITVTNPNTGAIDTYNILYNVDPTGSMPGNYVDLQLASIPEPAAAWLLLPGIAILAFRRRPSHRIVG